MMVVASDKMLSGRKRWWRRRWRRRRRRLRGCLHVSESPYELPYDSVHNFYANRIGIQLFFCHPLQWFVFTFQPKKIKN
jgi:hypothetical protein